MQSKLPIKDGEKVKEALIEEISKKYKSDIFLYNGDINSEGLEIFLDITKQRVKENVILILNTYGGNPDFAYVMSTIMQRYEKFFLLVVGICKSAGTLIAVASDEIIMGELGEFGPLDVQVLEENNPTFTSTLNTIGAISLVTETAIDTYINTIRRLEQEQLITTTTLKAAEKLACTSLNSLLSQIPPTHLAEIDRISRLCRDYGERLIQKDEIKNVKRGNINKEKLEDLITGYRDHAFVINRKESKSIFENVRNISKKEEELVGYYFKTLRNPCNNDEQGVPQVERLTKIDNNGEEEYDPSNQAKNYRAKASARTQEEDDAELMESVH